MNTWIRLRNGLQMNCRPHSKHVGINTTISQTNSSEIRGIVELTKMLGAYCFNAFILVPTGRAQDLADEILDPIQYEVMLNELLLLKVESSIEVRVTCGPQLILF